MAAGDIDLGARIGKLEAQLEDRDKRLLRLEARVFGLGVDPDEEDDDDDAADEVDPVLGVSDSQIEAGLSFIAGEFVSAIKSKKARAAGAPNEQKTQG